MGLKGHLTAGEIIEQLVHAIRVAPVRNIVFMVCVDDAVSHGSARIAGLASGQRSWLADSLLAHAGL